MARKKVTIERTPIKPVKKKRKLSEETKEKLRARLADMRAKKKPAEYKNVSKKVLALPLSTDVGIRVHRTDPPLLHHIPTPTRVAQP